jgi:hypothetical protein
MLKHVIIMSVVAGAGCVARQGLEQRGFGSKLSDVQINVPRGQQLHSIFGPNCQDLKFSDETMKRLNTTEKCEAAGKLLDGFELTITKETCEPGSEGTSTNMVGSLSVIKPKDKVAKGCTYSVHLDIGEIESAKVYYSNKASSKNNLVVPKDAPALIQLRVQMAPSSDAVALGFPADAIQTDGVSDLSIEVEFGRRNSSPSSSPSPGASSVPAPSRSPVPLPVPSRSVAPAPVPPGR